MTEENKGAKQLAHNPICTSNSKHIDIHHHFLRVFEFRGKFNIISVESEMHRMQAFK